MSILKLQGEIERKNGVYYEVDPDSQPIGTGGMGQVFRGFQVEEATGATRPVAIKFLFDDLPADAIEKSRREANIKLQNDNLVEMLGFIETESKAILGVRQRHYHVVSELLWGVSLQDVMNGNTKDFEGNEVPYAVELLQEYKQNPLEFSKKIVHTVLLGLIALHNAGYIHRDIDPSNIMITRDRKIKLIDFGIAKKFKELSADDVSRTKAGVFIGKPQYAAPELVLGDIAHQNQTTDIYAMGILLYQCATGKVPFDGDMAAVLEQQRKKNLPLRFVKNRYLKAIIKKATQKRREDRFQSSAEMMVALERLPSPLNESKLNGQRVYLWGGIGLAVTILFLFLFLLPLTKGESVVPVQEVDTLYVVRNGRVVDLPGNTLVRNSVTDELEVPISMKAERAIMDMESLDSSKIRMGLDQLEYIIDSCSDFANAAPWMALYAHISQPDSATWAPERNKKLWGHVKDFIEHDAKRAHQLAEKAVALDATCYQALFELGTDYARADKRIGDDKCLDFRKALSLFDKGRALARAMSDVEYDLLFQKRYEQTDSIIKKNNY